MRDGSCGRRPTGACATAATTAAYTALLTGEFPDPVRIDLPNDKHPSFALSTERLEDGAATVGIVKDAGDDPDVTHGALVSARVTHGEAGSGVTFRAGTGVGTVTKPGLPLPVGEPAINPMPRQFVREHVAAVALARSGRRQRRQLGGVDGLRVACRGARLRARSGARRPRGG